jgi:hypothetical protein
MFYTHTFGDSTNTPVLLPMVEELNKLDKKNANKVASFINTHLVLINCFNDSSNDAYYREYMRKHLRRDIIDHCERLPQNIKSFVRNFLLTKLRICTQHQPKLKSGVSSVDRVGTVLFTDKPTHGEHHVIKVDMVMLLDSKTGLYNRVWKNRYGKQGYIHAKKDLPGQNKG